MGTCASWIGPQLVAAQLAYFGHRWDIVLATVAASNVVAAANYARNVIVNPIEHIAVAKRRR